MAVLTGCSPDSEPIGDPPPVLAPKYPTGSAFDYRPRSGIAHVALPRFNPEKGAFEGASRLWLKGSKEHPLAVVDGATEVPLEAPFYTATLDVDPGEHSVVFDSNAGAGIKVFAPSARSLNAQRPSVMILGYGCFDPFDLNTSKERRGEVFVSPGDGTGEPGAKGSAYSRFPVIRRVLQRAAAGDLVGVPPASVILGAGDQVYVEPAHDRYGEFGEEHSLSAWTVEAHPKPRLGLAAFHGFLDATYRAFWSFDTMDSVFTSIPSVLTWDDHEIRDGWGSQGDEHVYRDTYYQAARDAFIAHQYARGPMAMVPAQGDPQDPLHQSFTVHGVPIFVMDQRSARDIRVPQVLGDAQTHALKEWLRRIDPSDQPVCLIVSPLPMLYRVSGLVERVASFDESIVDDMLDSWNSEANKAELDTLMMELSLAYDRGIRPLLLSGDMHTSALLSARRRRTNGGASEVIAHELIVSGLASLVDGASWKFDLAKENSLVGGDVKVGDQLMSFEIGISKAVPNFGGLEVKDGEVFVHLFQAREEGVVHYTVPVEYGDSVSPLKDRIISGRELMADTSWESRPLAVSSGVGRENPEAK